MTAHVTFQELCTKLLGVPHLDRPFVVAISGFGGASKSTLAKQLSEQLGDIEVISGDDFIISQLAERCDDWASIDRARLREEVLEPANAGQAVCYQQYDWPNDRLGDWQTVGTPRLLIIEGIGIIHPDTLPFFDLTFWIDVPLEVASERGRYRAKEIYKVDHDALWRDVWTPNDRDYFERFHPDTLVDFIYAPSDKGIEP